VAAGQRVLRDIDVSETVTAATAPPVNVGSPVSTVYGSLPCLPQSGGEPVVYQAVVDAGNGGPALMLWQASAWTQSAPVAAAMQPAIAEQSDESLAASAFLNGSSMHMALLRRRALVKPLPPGQSFVGVTASQSTVTDANDTVNMALINFGAISAPPQVQLSTWGSAEGNGDYTSQSFNCEGGPLFISVDASAWSTLASQLIGAVLYLDGEVIATPQLFANWEDTHVPLVGVDLVITGVAPGGHTLDLQAASGTTVDQNDVWSLTVMEMQGPSTATQLIDNAPCPAQQGGGVLASVPYTASGGDQLICLSLSGFSTSDDQMLQAQVLVDGDPVGGLMVFANPANTHMALSGGDIVPGTMPAGQRTIEVVAGPEMVTDGNDRISLTILELLA
jgi:hypothetical protein